MADKKDGKEGKRIHVTLTPKIYELLEKCAERKGISKSALISIAVEKFTKEEESHEK